MKVHKLFSMQVHTFFLVSQPDVCLDFYLLIKLAVKKTVTKQVRNSDLFDRSTSENVKLKDIFAQNALKSLCIRMPFKVFGVFSKGSKSLEKISLQVH